MASTDGDDGPELTTAQTLATILPSAGMRAPAIAPVARDADPWTGTVFAERYRVLERIGSGAMGAVYRAEHVALRKRVAIKLLHREMAANREVVARFEREALAAAHLAHPNVAAATDFGRLPDGTSYLVMEYVEGRSLRALLDASGALPLPLPRALRILEQVGAALGRAHALGIIHRDLKPENVVVGEHAGEPDAVKVIDFGIARLTGPELQGGGTALTAVGSVFGTPEYMSPEQAVGKPAGPAADQYALGVMAFEALTGRAPYAAEEPIELLQLHIHAPVPAASQRAPALPPAVDPVLARMLAKDPAARFESVAAAIDALGQALRASPLATLAPGALTASAVAGAHATPQTAGSAAPSLVQGFLAGMSPTQRLVALAVLVAGVVLLLGLVLATCR